MQLNFTDDKAVYIQIADWLESEILSGGLKIGDRAFSQNELAQLLRINPATAAKGINLLVERNVLEKRRGIGMFVTQNAATLIAERRKNEELSRILHNLIAESKKLSITEEELLAKIKEGWNFYDQSNLD